MSVDYEKIALILVFSAVFAIVFTNYAMTEKNTIIKSKVEKNENTYSTTPANISDINEGAVRTKTVYNTIKQGQTKWHTKSLGHYTTTYTHLNWGDTSDSLKLTIYTPDGKILGPYFDNSDGSLNGRIDLCIRNSNGLATGTWSYRICGQRVSNIQEYSI